MIISYFKLLDKLWHKEHRTAKEQRQLDKLIEWHSVELIPL